METLRDKKGRRWRVCGNAERECDHLLKFICPMFTPPTNIAVRTTAWINWAAVCSGRHNPQQQTHLFFPDFLGKGCRCGTNRIPVSDQNSVKIEPNFKEAFSNNQKVCKKKQVFFCIPMSIESDDCAITQWIASSADKDCTAETVKVLKEITLHTFFRSAHCFLFYFFFAAVAGFFFFFFFLFALRFVKFNNSSHSLPACTVCCVTPSDTVFSIAVTVSALESLG